MGVDSWVWMAVGMALIIAIASRMKNEEIRMNRVEDYAQNLKPTRLQSEDGGVFEVKVVAIEFDEIGPVLYINGEFEAPKERVEIDIVTADINLGAVSDSFTPFDPSTIDDASERQIGDLINFIGPVTLQPTQRGKFRAPLLSPEREERMAILLERLDHAAQTLVEKYDSEFGDYSLEGESLVKMESDFTNDFVVREIASEIEQEFIWTSGEANLVVRFLNSYEESMEEAPVRFYLTPSESQTLRENISGMILNSLRAELDLDLIGYNAIVCER
jgi:hypothetical protein